MYSDLHVYTRAVCMDDNDFHDARDWEEEVRVLEAKVRAEQQLLREARKREN